MNFEVFLAETLGSISPSASVCLLLLFFCPSPSLLLFLPAFFSSIHFCLSLVSFLPQPESKEDHTLSSLLSCILSVVNEKALSCFHEWPLFRENAMGPSNIPIAHVPLHSRVILKICPPGVSFQASAASILTLQTQQCCLLSLGWQCKPTLKGVHLIWQKRLYSY